MPDTILKILNDPLIGKIAIIAIAVILVGAVVFLFVGLLRNYSVRLALLYSLGAGKLHELARRR